MNVELGSFPNKLVDLTAALGRHNLFLTSTNTMGKSDGFIANKTAVGIVVPVARPEKPPRKAERDINKNGRCM